MSRITGRSSNPRSRIALLTLGAIGVVYGDIGTSPLYAFREAMAQMLASTIGRAEITGVLSLALWALIIVVTIKYVLFLTRADNHGEGGVLSLMALASRATGGRWRVVLLLGAAGAALFYGDAIITPAVAGSNRCLNSSIRFCLRSSTHSVSDNLLVCPVFSINGRRLTVHVASIPCRSSSSIRETTPGF